MDNVKVGKLILKLRKEKGMTQKELADILFLSDRTISKWECGKGCPDVSLLQQLSHVLEVNIEKILLGELKENEMVKGNIKKVQFYACPTCNNVLFSTAETSISCCGKKLNSLVCRQDQFEHELILNEVENDYYLTIQHEMTKTHYISFVAYVSYDRILFIKLYPEQAAEARFTRLSGGEIYIYCNLHGLIKLAHPSR